jgi:Fibronectin type III domain
MCAVLLSTAACVFVTPDAGDADPPTASPEPGQPYAAELTDEWVSYGRKATCADWAGADGIQGVRLNRTTIAWFFSDTYLGTVREAIPAFRGSMIANSLVIQRTAKRTTVTGGAACAWDRLPASKPRPVVSTERSGQWYWGGDGIVVGDRVVKFFHRFGWGDARYHPYSTAVTSVPVRDLTKRKPSKSLRMRPRELPGVSPIAAGTPIMWGAALLPVGDTVYVYGWQAPDLRIQQKRLYLARVPKARLADMSAWTYYAGAGQWTTTQWGARPVQPIGADLEVSSAFSVAQLGGRYWLIQHEPAFESADIVAFPASTPWGPFDQRQGKLLYRAPDVGNDAGHDYKIIYDARVMEPLSTDKTIVIGYNVNTMAVNVGCRSLNYYTDVFYRPRFVTVPAAEFARPGGVAQRVGAGREPPYSPIVGRQPGQWFNTWSYPRGCPPVPAVTGVQATSAEPGTLTLSWRSAGADMSYRVYRRPAGRGEFTLVRTVNTPGVTLDDLDSGKRYEWRIQPINWKDYTGPVRTGIARVS